MMGGDSPWDSVGSFPIQEEGVAALHQQAPAAEKLGLKVTEDVAAGSFTAAGGSGTCAVNACSTAATRAPRTRGKNMHDQDIRPRLS
jgi:hypothetical protein